MVTHSVDPRLEGVTAEREVLLRLGEDTTRSDMKLPVDEVEIRDELCHRVLDLDGTKQSGGQR
jgi:hypothetical protein